VREKFQPEESFILYALCWNCCFETSYSHSSCFAMSSSLSSNSPKKDRVSITTTELPDAEHLFPSDGTKSILSKGLGVFQELHPSKGLQHQVFEGGDHKSLIQKCDFRQEDDEINQATPRTVKQMLTQNINPTSPMFNAEPLAPSPRGPCFANTSQSFWYSATTPLFSKLLSTSQYPPHLQDQYLFFYNHSILPALGPSPSPSNKWTPHLTYNASPFEPSLALQNNKQQVRYTFEPTGPLAGTSEDRFNQSLPLAFVSALASTNVSPNLDLKCWNHFTNGFFVSDSEIAAHPTLFTGVKVHTTCFLAFDLPSFEFAPILKAYLFPHRRALLENMSRGDLVFDAIRNLPFVSTAIFHGLVKVKGFLSSCEESLAAQLGLQESELKSRRMSVEMLSFDCVSPAKSRLKIYAKTHNTSFSNVKNIFTLSNQLSSPQIIEGLKNLEQFWKCLLFLGEDWNDHESQSAEFLYFGFEVLAGRQEPKVKVYVPTWTLGIDKTGLTRGLGTYFREQGWNVGSTYRTNVGQLL
jgi:DMATS type aromatic prenyltransferase